MNILRTIIFLISIKLDNLWALVYLEKSGGAKIKKPSRNVPVKYGVNMT